MTMTDPHDMTQDSALGPGPVPKGSCHSTQLLFATSAKAWALLGLSTFQREAGNPDFYTDFPDF